MVGFNRAERSDLYVEPVCRAAHRRLYEGTLVREKVDHREDSNEPLIFYPMRHWPAWPGSHRASGRGVGPADRTRGEDVYLRGAAPCRSAFAHHGIGFDLRLPGITYRPLKSTANLRDIE